MSSQFLSESSACSASSPTLIKTVELSVSRREQIVPSVHIYKHESLSWGTRSGDKYYGILNIMHNLEVLHAIYGSEQIF